MTPYNYIVKELRSLGVAQLTKNEEQIIVFHLSIGEDKRAIISLIMHRRYRITLLDQLSAFGINIADLTPIEIDWLEDILVNKRIDIDSVVNELLSSKSENRKLKDMKV